jgi:hypothetical protein
LLFAVIFFLFLFSVNSKLNFGTECYVPATFDLVLDLVELLLLILLAFTLMAPIWKNKTLFISIKKNSGVITPSFNS